MDTKKQALEFFWNRYIERAMWFFREKSGKFQELVINIQKIKIDERTPEKDIICISCGSYLSDKYCNYCSDLLDLEEKGSIYFVVDHFEEQDYIIKIFERDNVENDGNRN